MPEASLGRADEATIRPARLLEDATLGWHAVGAAEPYDGPLGFLDGIQRFELVGYAGAAPIVAAEIAAAVRERQGRRLVTVVEERRSLVLARPAALAAAGAAIDGLVPVALSEDAPPHPVRDLHQAARALDAARGALEVRVGSAYRDRSDAWLVVDGSLAESPAWAADPRMIAVAKSHATLPFDGPELERYLRLPCGHRSSVYAPASREVAPVAAWVLRLWPWEGRDLLHGLVRIEVAPANGEPAIADRISRWILAERVPISAPDARWDRLLYGIRSVEEYLRSSGAA